MTRTPVVRRSTFGVRRSTAGPRTANREPRTSRSNLRGLPNDARKGPPLAPAHRPRLDDGDRVAGLRFVLFVVDHERRRAPFGLAVEAVADLPFHGAAHALLPLVADDDADFLRLVGH